jgi:hypothetical protein
MNGSTVCRVHGGAAPHTQLAARVRLQNAADRMARELLKMAIDENVSDSVKLTAIRDALDRGGVGAKAEVDVSISPTLRADHQQLGFGITLRVPPKHGNRG